MPNHYYMRRGAKIKGPFTLEKIQRLIEDKKLKSKDELSTSANGPWEFLKDSFSTIYPDSSKVNENHPQDAYEADLVFTGEVKHDVPEAIVVSDTMVVHDNKKPSNRVKSKAENKAELKARAAKREIWLQGVILNCMGIGFVALIIICLIGAVVEKATTSGGSSSKTKIDDTAVRYVGRQRLRAILRDPDSLQIISETVVKPGRNGGEVGYRAIYRAKNGFGGYTQDEYYTE